METPREFLTALWGDPPPGVVLVWRLPGKESLWYTRLDTVNRDAERHTDEDVYTGVGIASRNGGRFTSRNKLTEEEVGGITGMWADIDWAHRCTGSRTSRPAGSRSWRLWRARSSSRPSSWTRATASRPGGSSSGPGCSTTRRTTSWAGGPPSGGTPRSRTSSRSGAG